MLLSPVGQEGWPTRPQAVNVLFALYGDFSSNSSIPLALHARELRRRGHDCAVALPSGLESAPRGNELRAALFADALAHPGSLFADGRPADVVHAWTPRENVRRFVTAYQSRRPTPWVVYLEDNEAWIAQQALAPVGLGEEVLLQHTDEVISLWTPQALAHPLRFREFIGLADAAVVIQDKLAVDVPPWVPCTTVMPGVDLELFAPREPHAAQRARLGIGEDERVIVYPGGLNGFTRPGIEALCRAVGLVNERGYRCRLLRSGPVALDFLGGVPAQARAAVTDVGVLPREEMPAFLALADAFVQPGKPDAFEDLRLPGKLPELFAMGRPVVLPGTNIAALLRDGVDAVIHRTGSPEEMADKCIALFADPARARAIGAAGRRFAEANFDPAAQAARLERVLLDACRAFDAQGAAEVWSAASGDGPLAPVLAKRLYRMASAKPDDASRAAMMRAHARAIERSHERERNLETGLKSRDADIAAMKSRAADLQAQVEALGTAAHELREAVDRLQQSVVDRQARIAAIESSLSWRITAPLRWLGRLLGR